MNHGNVNNRAKNLTPQELRDLTMPPEAIKAANDEHDRKYGFKPGEGQAYGRLAPGGACTTGCSQSGCCSI